MATKKKISKKARKIAFAPKDIIINFKKGTKTGPSFIIAQGASNHYTECRYEATTCCTCE